MNSFSNSSNIVSNYLINDVAHEASKNLTHVAAFEEKTIEACALKFEELQKNHLEWFESYEDAVPNNAPRQEVVELLASAPNDFAAGLMYGIFMMRQELAYATDRDFK